jgi:hypothetical protein
MSDFYATWSLVRGRFDDSVAGLTQEQLNWRLHPGTLTIGEMILHVAGVETSFITQLLGEEPTGLAARLKQAATEGVVNENPFPFTAEETTPELGAEALAYGRQLVAPLMQNPDPYRERSIKSALGPIIDGTGTFARLAYHPAYHQAQVHMIRTAPGFPA